MGNGGSTRTGSVQPQRAVHEVRLAATPLVPYAPSVAQAYHTSIAVGDVELTFNHRGISLARCFDSHSHLPQGPPQILDMGFSPMSVQQLTGALKPFFQEREYDLLRKNCNSFSDCALFFLLGRRLDSKYSELERIGKSMEEVMGLVGILSQGKYKPNPRADGFDLEEVVKTLGYNKKEIDETVRTKVWRKSDRATCLKPHKPGTLVKGKEKSTKGYKPGMHIEVFSQKRKGWVRATVTGVTKTGTVTVLYENGLHQKDVPVKDLATVLRALKIP